MTVIKLFRHQSTNEGTFGVILADGFWCHTLELPWRDNRPNLSCIPEGFYTCEMVISPRFGQVYQVLSVPGRSHILFHSGNLAGNVAQGLKTHVQGCILLGQRVGTLSGQPAVLVSRIAFNRFMAFLSGEKQFILEVKSWI